MMSLLIPYIHSCVYMLYSQAKNTPSREERRFFSPLKVHLNSRLILSFAAMKSFSLGTQTFISLYKRENTKFSSHKSFLISDIKGESPHTDKKFFSFFEPLFGKKNCGFFCTFQSPSTSHRGPWLPWWPFRRPPSPSSYSSGCRHLATTCRSPLP